MNVEGFQFQPKSKSNVTRNPINVDTTKSQTSNRLEDLQSWCSCNNCSVMTGYGFLEEEECLCCHKVVKKSNPYFKLEEIRCLTNHQDFEDLILKESNLYMGLVGMHDMMSSFLPNREEVTTKNYRYVAYRHFTWWVHNKLRKHIRRRIPACVLRKIREKFPAPDGIYVGFKEGKYHPESMASWNVEEDSEL